MGYQTWFFFEGGGISGMTFLKTIFILFQGVEETFSELANNRSYIINIMTECRIYECWISGPTLPDRMTECRIYECGISGPTLPDRMTECRIYIWMPGGIWPEGDIIMYTIQALKDTQYTLYKPSNLHFYLKKTCKTLILMQFFI